MDFNLRAYRVETGRIVAEHAIRPSGLQFEETEDGRIRFGGGGERGAMLRMRLTSMSQAACSADAATFFLSTQDDGGIHIFDTDSGKETDVVKPADHFRKYCVSTAGDLVATVEQLAVPNADPHDRASRRYVLRIRDVATGELVNEVPLDGGFGYQMAFSPDGKLIAASQSALNWTPAADKWIDVWDVASLERVARLAQNTPAVRGIAFSHNGRRLASSHEDSTVTVWDLEVHAPAR
jgi:WD40 repeat protein